MSGNAVSWSLFVTLSYAVIVFLPGAAGAGEPEVTITGILEPVETDDNDTVTSVALFDPEYGTVLVRNGGKGTELIAHAWEEVSITGVLEELDDNSGYTHAITVSRYELLNAGTQEDHGQEEEDRDPGRYD